MPDRYTKLEIIKSYRKTPGMGSTIHLHQTRAIKALGHALPLGAVVHHADGTRNDTGPLVICPGQTYHVELHRKMRIQAAGGNPWTQRMCGNCGPLSFDNFYPSTKTGYCKSCDKTRHNAYYSRSLAYRLRACQKAKARQQKIAFALIGGEVR